jgi:DNA repair protein RadC
MERMTDRVLEANEPFVSSVVHDAPRPRERLALLGPEALSEVELLALLLGGGRSAQRASRLLEWVGSLRTLAGALVQELVAAPGLGAAGASAIVAAFELGRRLETTRLPWAEALREPQDVIDFVRARLRGATQERFEVIGLDARQRVRLVRQVAMGSLSQVDVHPRELFRPLMRAGMHSCVLVHNHPSGDAQPSRADVELTHRMCEVGRLVGVPVLDHIVVTDDGATSLAARGLLERA